MNDFFTIFKVEVTLPLAEQIEGIYSDKEEKSSYTIKVKRMNLVGIVEYKEKANKK